MSARRALAVGFLLGWFAGWVVRWRGDWREASRMLQARRRVAPLHPPLPVTRSGDIAADVGAPS